MGKRKSDLKVEEVAEKKSKEKVELSVDKKLIVLAKLMPQARSLFEKFNANLDKTKTKELWTQLNTELKDEGIFFEDWFKLKETVRNWYGRAVKKNDALRQTGASGGSAKQLSDFEQECLAFVRACKGDCYVDLIESVESTGTDAVAAAEDTTTQQHNTDDEELPTTSNQTTSNQKSQTQTLTRPNLKKNVPTTPIAKAQEWKEKYFNTVEDIEKMRLDTQSKDAEFKRYVLFLQATKLEQDLGLNVSAIREMRDAIASKASISAMPIIMKSVEVTVEENSIIDE